MAIELNGWDEHMNPASPVFEEVPLVQNVWVVEK